MNIVGYKWKSDGIRSVHEKWGPILLVEDDEEIKKIPVFDKNVSMKLGERFCIGHFSDGKHVECPKHEKITTGWYCNYCRKADDFFSCVQCSGECMNEKKRHVCKEGKYFVYLAVFDSLLKVGISQEHRLHERLIEQGADFAAKVALFKDGMVVRKVEQELKKSLSCADRIHGQEKHKRLFGDPNTSVITITKALAMLKDKFDVNAAEIYDLRRFYRLENVKRKPRMITVKNGLDVSGRVIAAKGNLMLLKNGFYYALNAHDLIGREADIEVN